MKVRQRMVRREPKRHSQLGEIALHFRPATHAAILINGATTTVEIPRIPGMQSATAVGLAVRAGANARRVLGFRFAPARRQVGAATSCNGKNQRRQKEQPQHRGTMLRSSGGAAITITCPDRALAPSEGLTLYGVPLRRSVSPLARWRSRWNIRGARVAFMSWNQKYFRVLSGLAPASAVGVSLLLGSATPSGADDHLAVQSDGAVSERLAAIRDAVSAIVESETAAGEAEGRLAWGNVIGSTAYRWPNMWQSHQIRRWGNYWANTLNR